MRALIAVGTVWCFFSCQQNAPAPAPTPPPTSGHFGGYKAIGGHEGANPGFDRELDPAGIMRQLAIKPGEKVADVGAGLGYYVPRLSEAVGPEGALLVTDIDEDAVASLRELAKSRPNVTVRQTQPNDPGLEPGQYDLVFMSAVDHFLDDRVSFLRALARGLKPGGRLAVTHTMQLKAPLSEAAEKAGLKVVGGEDRKLFYILIFQPQ